MNRYSDRDPRSIAKSTPDHWVLFLIEGVALILLGLLAIAVPSITSENVTVILGWLFLASGVTGLVTTYWARQAPGFLWSLVSALLAIFVGVVLIENKSQDLYGGLLGWPFHNAGPLRLILVLFFLVEGWCLHHARHRAPASVLPALGIDVRQRRRRHRFGQYHHFCSSRHFGLDTRFSGRD